MLQLSKVLKLRLLQGQMHQLLMEPRLMYQLAMGKKLRLVKALMHQLVQSVALSQVLAHAQGPFALASVPYYLDLDGPAHFFEGHEHRKEQVPGVSRVV